MPEIPKKRREAIYRRDKGRCFWCKKALAFDEATMDHVIPKSLGGYAMASNLVTACGPCNQRRGNDLDLESLPERYRRVWAQTAGRTRVEPTLSLIVRFFPKSLGRKARRTVRVVRRQDPRFSLFDQLSQWQRDQLVQLAKRLERAALDGTEKPTGP